MTPVNADSAKIPIDAHHTTPPLVSSGRGVMEELLGAKDLHAIYSDVFDTARKWYNFDLALGLLPDELDKLSSAHRDEPDVCLREMLRFSYQNLPRNQHEKL